MSSDRSKEGLALIQDLQNSIAEIKAKIKASGEAKLVESGEGSLEWIFQQIVDTAMQEISSNLTNDTESQFAEELCQIETKLVTLLSEWEENKEPSLKQMGELFSKVNPIQERLEQIQQSMPSEENKLQLECNEDNLLNLLKECITVESVEVTVQQMQEELKQEELLFLPSQEKPEIFEFNIVKKTQHVFKCDFVCPSNYGICCDGNKAYIAGGTYDPEQSSSLDSMYEISQSGVTALSSLKKKRFGLSLALLQKAEIYATGGQAIKRLTVVQRYEIKKDIWEQISSMIRPHTSHGSTGFGSERVYVFLGLSTQLNTKAIEVYEKSSKEWKDVRLKGQLQNFRGLNCLSVAQKGLQNKIILWSKQFSSEGIYFEFSVSEDGEELTAVVKPTNKGILNTDTETPILWSQYRQAVVTFNQGTRDVWEITGSEIQKFEY